MAHNKEEEVVSAPVKKSKTLIFDLSIFSHFISYFNFTEVFKCEFFKTSPTFKVKKFCNCWLKFSCNLAEKCEYSF